MFGNSSRQLIKISVGSVTLEGIMSIPSQAKSVVIFAHGSGSTRHSPRNVFVADVLNDSELGTLLFDLLTHEEDAVYENRFNIKLLTERLKGATDWFLKQYGDEFKVGYFGASTGAASALEAAATLKDKIGAVVSRGGRPDLAKHILGDVVSPTLLIVGGYDDVVIELNKEAYDLIGAKKELSIVPGASHLFEEPGKLEKVAELAKSWFGKYLVSS